MKTTVLFISLIFSFKILYAQDSESNFIKNKNSDSTQIENAIFLKETKEKNTQGVITVRETPNTKEDPQSKSNNDTTINQIRLTTPLGRRVDKLETPQECNKKGNIAVDLVIDETGKVMMARIGITGSTTNDIQLMKSVENAVLKSKFKPANENTSGKLIYFF